MIDFTRKLMVKLAQDTRGLTAVEYAVLGAIVVAAIVAATTNFGTTLTNAFEAMFSEMSAGGGE